MTGSDGIQTEEIEGNTDTEGMTETQRKLYDRRMSINKLVAYKTERQIADEIGCSLTTVERDIRWLKKEIYRRQVDDLVENGFSFDILKTKRRLEDKLLKMYRVEDEFGETPAMAETEQLIPLWKIQNDTESLLNNIVGEGPTLQGLKKAVEKSASD